MQRRTVILIAVFTLVAVAVGVTIFLAVRFTSFKCVEPGPPGWCVVATGKCPPDIEKEKGLQIVNLTKSEYDRMNNAVVQQGGEMFPFESSNQAMLLIAKKDYNLARLIPSFPLKPTMLIVEMEGEPDEFVPSGLVIVFLALGALKLDTYGPPPDGRTLKQVRILTSNEHAKTGFNRINFKLRCKQAEDA